ncbi:RING-H2 finger protein ATL3 [Brachypodium distachyon]|uniref:RING-type domain-containing protein n=1 Tax=Brachypodium distachyon TaxID=15368 RepID=I1IV24_BRADI|nr:RING-H2 finger protein ATL3 [Brachypodium distachyon]KQJ92570.1 hypothetical protein BRADI_4g44520v3 [Brachypodium distachyon]|eukprot:XP_010239554.1 RING-H2 finger protein ATL3 [Brachypodium distachyon]
MEVDGDLVFYSVIAAVLLAGVVVYVCFFYDSPEDEAAAMALRIVDHATLPRRQRRHGQDQESLDCTVCMGKMEEEGEACCVLPACGHEFHRDCMAKWIQTSRRITCPVCRTFVWHPDPVVASMV